MSSPESSARELSRRAGEVLGAVADVSPAPDGSLTVRYENTRAVVRAVQLAPGLDVISLIQVVAWDLANTSELREAVETCSAQLSFGTARRASSTDDVTDVLHHYNFPAGTLDDQALLTVLHMVLAAGADMSRSLSTPPTA